MLTIGPNGITDSAVNAQITEIVGAKKYTTLSAVLGRMSSLKAIFRPSARVCSRPNGPTWLGPGPHLHPGHDPPLEPHAEQGHQHAEDERRRRS